MRHSANLDILRSFAIVLVLIDHLVPTLVSHAGFDNASIISFTNQIGHAGVLAFFVHTSLVLMYSLERMTCGENRVTARFYIRRFFRIYPLSIFCIMMALVLHIPPNTWRNTETITPLVIAANLFLVQNIITKTSVLTPLWSLPYEVQMYLVLPALYFLTLKRRSFLYIVGLFLAFCGLGLVMSLKTGHLNMAAYVPCFICGVLCFSLRNSIRARIPAVFWIPFVVLLICGYCLTNLNGKPNMWIGWVYCLLLGLSINAFYDNSNRAVKYIAEKGALYSYGAYLLHVPVLYLVFMVFGIQNLVFGPLLFLTITVALSIFTYHFIESPFIEMGRRFSSPRKCSTDFVSK